LSVVVASAVPLGAADRLTDKDVKSLVERIDEARDRFEDALDGKLKSSIVRGPNGEVNVSRFLDDFQENVDRLKERMTPEYSASAEAGAVLRQASIIDRFFRAQAPGTRGESEWNRLSSDLETLATAFGTEFPPPENAAIRRVGDRELAVSVEEIGKTADRVKKSLDNELKKIPTVDGSSRQAIVADVDQLAKDAKALRGRVKDGKPSSAEAQSVLTRATKLQSFIAGHQVPASAAAWAGATKHLQGVASAYGVAWPGTN
jgi:hypothetical protein